MNVQLRRAKQALQQWLATARQTGEMRHYRTAATCHDIVGEVRARNKSDHAALHRAKLAQQRALRRAVARDGD